MTPVYVLLALTIKHFVCDFPLQAFPYMYRNKGSYGHLGGLLHTAIHVVGTGVALVGCGFGGEPALLGGLLDGMVHYHVDWVKMNIGARFNLKPDNSEWFWILLGADQLLHYLTYFAIVWIWIL